MKGEPGVIDYLNKGLRHELTAINQYWLHYRLLDNWGYKIARQAMAQGIHRRDAARRQAGRTHHLPRRLSQHAGARSAAYRPEREGSARLRSRRRNVGARALRGSRHALPRGPGLRVARPVRKADARRGGTHRLPRNPARPCRQARRSSSTPSITSANSTTTKTDATVLPPARRRGVYNRRNHIA